MPMLMTNGDGFYLCPRAPAMPRGAIGTGIRGGDIGPGGHRVVTARIVVKHRAILLRRGDILHWIWGLKGTLFTTNPLSNHSLGGRWAWGGVDQTFPSFVRGQYVAYRTH